MLRDINISIDCFKVSLWSNQPWVWSARYCLNNSEYFYFAITLNFICCKYDVPNKTPKQNLVRTFEDVPYKRSKKKQYSPKKNLEIYCSPWILIGLFVNIFVILVKSISFLKLTYFLNQIAHTQAKMKKQRIPAPPTVIALSVVIPEAPPASSAKISISELASLSIFSASAMI